MRKYALTLAALPRQRYANAFEPGCSIGVLSELLAGRCERLLCSDIVETALKCAAGRLRDLGHVRVVPLAIPDEWPDEFFDLIVLSEIAYYFDDEALDAVVDHVVASTLAGSHVVGVHWRGTTNYAATADDVHSRINHCPQLHCVVHHEEEMFILEIWERVP
jgi:hypothetical protein